MLAVNKPAGLLCVPGRYDKAEANLWDLLRSARALPDLTNPHRLDRYTSGVMIFTKTIEAYRSVTEQFRERQTRKIYTALCRGDAVAQTIDLPIGERPDTPGLSRIDHKHGKPSRTHLRVVERYRGYSLLEVEIETGRQHQIRVHLQAVGHPLVGDADYGGAPLLLSQLKRDYRAKAGEAERPLLARPALHAAEITLADPAVTIRAPLPKDLVVALKYLRRYAR